MKHFTAIVIAAALVFYGLFLAVLYSRGLLSERPLPPLEKNPPGWDRLTQCSDLMSFDGATTLTLDDDHNATLGTDESDDKPDEKAGPETKGHWGLVDKDAQTYSIDLGGKVVTYSLIMPPGAEGCMLMPGTDRKHMDVESAWFSKPDPDDT